MIMSNNNYKSIKEMKRLSIGWAIFSALGDIALIVLVCKQWDVTGSPWWSLLLASLFYTVGCITVWWFFDSILSDYQRRFEDDIYYQNEKDND